MSSATGASCWEPTSTTVPRTATDDAVALAGLGGLEERLALLDVDVLGLDVVADVGRRDPPVVRHRAAARVERVGHLRRRRRARAPRRATPATAARLGASASLPLSVLKTIVASAPASAGVCSRNRSIACCDSVPGTAKSSAAGRRRCPRGRRGRRSRARAMSRLRFQRWVSVRARRARAFRHAVDRTAAAAKMQRVHFCNGRTVLGTVPRVSSLRERKKQRTREQIVARRRCGCSPSAASTGRRSPTSPRPPTSRRARSSATSRPRRTSSSTTRRGTLERLVARLRDARRKARTRSTRCARGCSSYDAHTDFDKPEERARRMLIRETPSLAARERTLIARLGARSSPRPSRTTSASTRRLAARRAWSARPRSPRSTRSPACTTKATRSGPPRTSSTRRSRSSRAASTPCAACRPT